MALKSPRNFYIWKRKKERKEREYLPLVSSKRIPVLSKRCSRKLRAVLECPIRIKGAKEGRDKWTNNKCTFQEGERKEKKVFRNNASPFVPVLCVITSFKSLFFFNKILIYYDNNNIILY